MAGSDKRKQSLYFPEEMLKEIQDEAARQDRSLSWIVQKAWKLARKDIAGEATPNRDDNNEAEPVVVAYVRIDGEGIDPADSLSKDPNLLVTGTEVIAKVRCGNHAMGYSLFYGVWEFIYEKVVFFF